jgi:hypothetical protein
MKLAAKLLAVLSVLALAAPALACGDKTTTAKADEAKAAPAQTVAKSDAKKKSSAHAKHASQAKPAAATASN